MKRRVQVVCIILAAYIALVLYANRALLSSRFDKAYWQDRYEQSQWRLPLSDRVIGDDGLYLYEGYRLIRGGDPTISNAEMPPLGKYLIGTSIVLFGNGHIYGLIITLLLLLTTYILAKKILKETFLALAAAMLLATDPLITNQYTLTMMDALQALLLVIYLALLARIENGRRHVFYILVSGLTLGLFSGTKLPVLTPLLGIAGIWHLFTQSKKTQDIILFLIGVAAGYLLPYTVYFFQGHTVMDWLKIQKWIVMFYRQGNISPTWGSSITTLLTGYYQNLFSHAWERAAEWSPVWGLLTLATPAAIVAWIKTKKKETLSLLIPSIALIIIGIYAIIPFWTRYLVVILPLLYIAGIATLSRIPSKIFSATVAILAIINMTASLPVLFPSATPSINQFIYNTSHRQFADLYEDLTRDAKNNWSRNEFRSMGLAAMADAEIEHIEITPTAVTPYGYLTSPQYLSAEATFYTRRLGIFTHTITIPFVREDNRWRIPWKWDLLIPGLTANTRLETTVQDAKRGAILGSDKKPLAEDAMGVALWITPQSIDPSRENELLSLIETVFDGRIPKVAIHQRMVGNILPNTPVIIGTIPHPATDPNVVALAAFPGVTLLPAFTRLTYPNHVVDIGTLTNTSYSECCTYLYTTTTYDGVSGTEKIKNNQLKGINGGTLVIKDAEGKIVKTLISVTKKDGENVQP